MKTPFVIKSLTAYVAIDPDDGNEGIIGERVMGNWMPFIGADEPRIRSLRPIVDNIMKDTPMTVKLVRFSVREDLETISNEKPKEKGQHQ